MSDLYTNEFLHYYKNQPYNKNLATVTNKGEDINSACGDEIKISLKVKDGKIQDVGYQTSGCVITTGAVSLLAENIVGKRVDKLRKMSRSEFINILPIKLTPSREKCALVGYQALMNAIKSN